MTNKLKFFPAILAASVLSLTSCDKEEEYNENRTSTQSHNLSQENGPGRYIVVLKDQGKEQDEQAANEALERVKNKHGLNKFSSGNMFRNVFRGFSAELTAEQAKALLADENVKYVEKEQIYTIEQTSTTTTTSSTQQIPWGVQKVGYVADASANTKTAWIIDSGIQLNHPDLNVDVARSRSFLSTTTSPDDQNGHGTFCAGIIAAKNNSFGVHGVAPGAKVAALRALDANGSGTTTSVIAALNYVHQNGKVGDVVNMSLGGPVSQALDDAVLNVAYKGIVVIIAAGNSATNVINVSPARVNQAMVYTISAMNQNNAWASFSNFGSPTVDFCAPGVNITSTSINSGYASGSGTSYAAPHVAGIVMLNGRNIYTQGYVTGDPDGTADRIARRY